LRGHRTIKSGREIPKEFKMKKPFKNITDGISLLVSLESVLPGVNKSVQAGMQSAVGVEKCQDVL